MKDVVGDFLDDERDGSVLPRRTEKVVKLDLELEGCTRGVGSVQMQCTFVREVQQTTNAVDDGDVVDVTTATIDSNDDDDEEEEVFETPTLKEKKKPLILPSNEKAVEDDDDDDDDDV